MELKGQEKEIGMPSSSVHHPSNRDSSSKVPSASAVPASGERSREHLSTTQALEGRPPYQHHHHRQTHKPMRDPDITPDPATSAIAATSATNIAPAAPGRSISGSPPPASTSSSVRYRECLRNHAASAGGLVIDGCGEFMPSGEEGTPEALKCAACECHRSFHRKEIDGELQYITNSYYKNSSHRTALPAPPQQLATSLPQLQPSPLHRHHRDPHPLSINRSAAPIAPIMLAFGSGAGGGAAAESSSEDLNIFQSNLQGQESGHPSSSKKRFRTKFSEEQKEKMMEFAEKLEWKIQKQDEQAVQQFCSQVGVKRKVFKVWMHNKKQATKKKQM